MKKIFVIFTLIFSLNQANADTKAGNKNSLTDFYSMLGLETEDVIKQINGKKISSLDEVFGYMRLWKNFFNWA